MTNIPIKLNLDLADITAPITKLIETIASAFGTVYAPRRIREEAKAEADAISILAHAEAHKAETQAYAEVSTAKARAEGDIKLQELAIRAQERLDLLELRRQRNIEAIANKAVAQLPETVDEEMVDEDWVIRFFNYAQDVGNEQMQELWARLLAGEVAQAGSFSLRTLQTVKMLRAQDANLFQQFATYIWSSRLHFYCNKTKDLLISRGLNYWGEKELISLGLISAVSPSPLRLYPGEIKELQYFRTRVKASNLSTDRRMHLHYSDLTSVGSELHQLCDAECVKHFETTPARY